MQWELLALWLVWEVGLDIRLESGAGRDQDRPLCGVVPQEGCEQGLTLDSGRQERGEHLGYKIRGGKTS